MKVFPAIQMPNDLPVQFTTLSTLPGASHNSKQPPLNSSTPTVTKGVNGKRQVSTEFAETERPAKRLGMSPHPSLVIDFESDDDDAEIGNRTDLAQARLATSDLLELSTASGGDSAAKLRQVEAEIAQAMAIISKAQELQNARKSTNEFVTLTRVAPKTSTDPQSSETSPEKLSESLPLVHPEIDQLNEQLLSAQKHQESQLRQLEVQLHDQDRQIAELRKELVRARLQGAENAKRSMIQVIREQSCQEVVQATVDEISRLQQDLVAQQEILAEVRSERELSEATIQRSNREQENLTIQIRSMEETKRSLHPHISSIKIAMNKARLSAGLRLDEPLENSATDFVSTTEVSQQSVSSLVSTTPTLRPAVALPTTISGGHALYTNGTSEQFPLKSQTQTRDLAAASVSAMNDSLARPVTLAQTHSKSSAEEGEITETISLQQSQSAAPMASQSNTQAANFSGLPAHTPSGPRALGKSVGSTVNKSTNQVRTEKQKDAPVAPQLSPAGNVDGNRIVNRADVSSRKVESHQHNSVADVPHVSRFSVSPLNIVESKGPMSQAGTIPLQARSRRVERAGESGSMTRSASGTPGHQPEAASSVHQPVASVGAAEVQSSNNKYISPLFRFRAFKYHIAYSSTVPNAFRSSTYFHQAKQDQILCKYETQGGSCQSAFCPEQHFKDIIMVSLLALLSSASDVVRLTTPDRLLPIPTKIC